MEAKRSKQDVKVSVVGAGAIGGVTAALLARAGWQPELVCKHQEIADRSVTQGIHVFGVRGESTIKVKAVKDIADLFEPKEVVFLATKAGDCVAAAQELSRFLSEKGAI